MAESVERPEKKRFKSVFLKSVLKKLTRASIEGCPWAILLIVRFTLLKEKLKMRGGMKISKIIVRKRGVPLITPSVLPRFGKSREFHWSHSRRGQCALAQFLDLKKISFRKAKKKSSKPWQDADLENEKDGNSEGFQDPNQRANASLFQNRFWQSGCTQYG